MTRIADRVDHPRSPIGANSLTARLTPPTPGGCQACMICPQQHRYCFFATPREVSRPSAPASCNSLPPSTMAKARVWLEPLLKYCSVPVPSGFTV